MIEGNSLSQQTPSLARGGISHRGSQQSVFHIALSQENYPDMARSERLNSIERREKFCSTRSRLLGTLPLHLANRRARKPTPCSMQGSSLILIASYPISEPTAWISTAVSSFIRPRLPASDLSTDLRCYTNVGIGNCGNRSQSRFTAIRNRTQRSFFDLPLEAVPIRRKCRSHRAV